jgi:hypothetical protein
MDDYFSEADEAAALAGRAKDIAACGRLLALLIEHHPDLAPPQINVPASQAKKSPALTGNEKPGERKHSDVSHNTASPAPQHAVL